MLRPAGNPGRPVRIGEPADGRPGRVGTQRGMVTAELAFASLGAAAAGVVLAWVLTLVALLVRCHDTAAEVARQEARADRSAVAQAIADRPSGAEVSIRHDDELVIVQVQLAARPWVEWLPPVPLSVSASVVREPA